MQIALRTRIFHVLIGVAENEGSMNMLNSALLALKGTHTSLSDMKVWVGCPLPSRGLQ